MNTTSHHEYHLSHNRQKINRDEVAFNNLFITPQKLASYFDKNLDSKFLSCVPINKNYIQNNCCKSEVLVRLYAQNLNKDLFLVINLNIVYKILSSLLFDDLFNDKKSIFLSDTEKGLFSYFLAKILFENNFTTIKIIGIYNNNEEYYKTLELINYCCINLDYFISQDKFNLNILAPFEAFKNIDQAKNKPTNINNLFFITDYLIIKLITLKTSLNTVHKLKFGDVVLFDNTNITTKASAHWKSINYDGDLINNNKYIFKIKNINKKTGDNMEELIDIDTNKNIIEDISIDLTIELSRIKMSLKEVCELKEDFIIELNKTIDEPLDLVINNKKIGTCVAVQINDRLGIKIVQMLNHGN